MAQAAKKKSPAQKKPRTAAQKAATAKMLAANKRARAAKSTTTARKPTAKKRPSYKKPAAKAPAKREYKRNPVAASEGVVHQVVHDMAIPAGIGIGGALATDAVWGNLKFIPVEKRVGKLKYLGKPLIGVGASIGLGLLLPKYRRHINQIGVGTLIVNGHAASSEYIQSHFPNLGLGGYDDVELNEAIAQLDGMGEALVNSSLPAPAASGLGAFHDIGYYASA